MCVSVKHCSDDCGKKISEVELALPEKNEVLRRWGEGGGGGGGSDIHKNSMMVVVV